MAIHGKMMKACVWNVKSLKYNTGQESGKWVGRGGGSRANLNHIIIF